DLDTKDGLKGIARMDWEAFGKGETTAPPEVGAVPEATTPGTGSSQLYDGYLQALNRLADVGNQLQDTTIQAVKKAKDSDDLRKVYQNKVGDWIRNLGDRAGQPPKDGKTEDENIMDYVKEELAAGEKLMTDAHLSQKDKASEIDDLTARAEKAEAAAKKWEDLYNKEKEKGGSGGDDSADPDNVDPGDADNADPGNNDDYTPDPIDTGDGTGDGTSDTGTGTGSTDPQDVGNSGSGSGSTDTPSTPSYDSGSDSGSDSGNFGDSMLPYMLANSLGRNQADPDMNDRRDEVDPNRYNQYPGAAVPANASQAPAQAATAAPATPASAPPSNATSAQPAVAPGRTPDADGSVLYTFPNGKTQKVSVICAQGLDAAFGNASSTDAQKAYEKTTAKWTDKKQIGAKVDPYQLMTGDVAIWENRTAIVVVFPEDGGTLEAIVDGQLVPCTAEMSDGAGDFGKFSGFSHPNGIELASGDKNAAPAVPGTGDPSAAAVPVVAAPA
ncbi:hypothetical protein AB0L58_41710, partial [Nocardia sp. NPDC052112]